MNKLEKVEKYIAKKKEADLIKLTHDKEKAVCLAAIAGIGQIGGDDSFNDLVDLLRSGDAEIRAAAASALGQLRISRADTDLRHQLQSEKDEGVISAIKSSLALLRTEGE